MIAQVPLSRSGGFRLLSRGTRDTWREGDVEGIGLRQLSFPASAPLLAVCWIGAEHLELSSSIVRIAAAAMQKPIKSSHKTSKRIHEPRRERGRALVQALGAALLEPKWLRIIEFPLTGVSKVYRIIRDDEKWYRVQGTMPTSPAEHIVVVEFMRRKLAFVFTEAIAALRFLTCMELLIRRAQQQEAERLRGTGIQRGVAQPVAPVIPAAPKETEEAESQKATVARPLYVCM